MANEKRKYRFGSNELDYENYIKNLDHNVDTFLNSQNWNDDQKQEFINAYSNYIDAYKSNDSDRFSADAFGRITDNLGLLSSNNTTSKYYDKKGRSIDSLAYSTLSDKEKKKYSGFNANTYVAQYFRDIAKGMVAKNPTSSNKFDFNKHGFFKYWSDKVNPAGGSFNIKPFVDKDELVDGKRSRTNRANYLADELKTYRENLADYDFSENVFGSKEKYLEALSNFEKSLRDGTFDAKDAQTALAAGINQDFFDQFFTEHDVYKTNELAKKDQEEADKKQAQEERNKWVDSEYKKYHDNKTGYYDVDSGFNIGDYSALFKKEDGSFDNQAFSDYFNQKNFRDYYVNGSFSPSAFGKKWLENPFNLNNTEHARHFIAGLIGKNLLSKIDSGKYKDMYYFGDSYSPDTNRVLVYDPTSGRVFYRFVGDVPKLWEDKVKQANLRGYTPATDASAYYIKNGGNISKNQFGGNIDILFKQGYDADLDKRAKKEGKTAEQQKAAERYINSDYATGENDAGFTDKELARVGSAVADLASAGLALIPGYGTAASAIAGLTSTGANLYADLRDEAVTGWETAGNAAFGLGMDIVGLIPGLGMVGKGAKVARSLTKLAPKVMKWIWMYSAATNAPEMIASWEKMISSDGKITSQDWENVMQSLNLVLGGAAAKGRNLKAKGVLDSNAKEINKAIKTVDNKVAVKLKDSAGNEKRVVFEGDDAKAIREADGNVDEIKKLTVDKFKDLEGYSVVESQNPFDGFSSPVKGWKVWSKENYQSPYRKKAKVDDVYTLNGKEFVELRGEFGIDDKLSKPGQTWKSIEDAYVDAQMAPIKQASLDYEAKLKVKDKTQRAIDTGISNLETKLGSRSSASLNDEIADIRTRYARYSKADKAAAKAGLQDTKAKLKTIAGAEQVLESTRKLLKKERAKRKPDPAEVTRLEQLEEVLKNDLESLVGKRGDKKRKLIADLTDYLKQIDEYTALEKEIKDISTKEAVRDEVKKIEKAIEKLQERRVFWDKFTTNGKSDARLKFELDYIPVEGKVTFHDPNTNRDIVRNFNEILKGIKFRKGGSIRKFQFAGNLPKLEPIKFEMKPLVPEFGKVDLMENGTLKYKSPFEPKLMEDNTLQLKPTSENNTNFLLQLDKKPITPTTPIAPTVTDVGSGGNEEIKKPKSTSNFLSKVGNILLNPNFMFGVPRAIADINANKRMTDLAISAEKPILKQSLNLSPITMHSDLAGEMAAQKNAGMLTSVASLPFTSDGRLQQAAMFDAQLKGLDYINQGKQKSDNVALNIAEKIKTLNDLETTKNLAIADENTAAMQATANNIVKHKLAGMSKEQTIKDTLSQQFENDYRANDSLRESLFKKDQTQLELDNAINGNLAGITDGQKVLLKKYKDTGTTGLTDLEKQELNRALAIVNDKVLTNWASYKGLSRSYNPSASTTPTSTPQYDFRYNKKGGKLDNYKLILSAIKENNKKIEKLSSTMINYFKDINK